MVGPGMLADGLGPISLAEALERHAALTPGKVALISDTHPYTFAELNAETNLLANAWLNSGALSGDIVCSFLPKGFAFAVCFLATQKAGLIFASLNPATKPQILARQVRALKGSYFVLPQADALARTVTTARPQARVLIPHYGTPGSQTLRWDGLRAGGSQDNPPRPSSPDDVCYLNLTSGTTSAPKAAVATAANIYWNAVAAVSALGLTPEDIHLCTFPSFLHPHEILARSIYLGGTSVLVGFDLPLLWRVVRESNVTCMMSNPTIYGLLVDYSRRLRESPPALRLAESGGSIVPVFLAEAVDHHLRAELVPVWGSAETMGIAIAAKGIPRPVPELLLGRVCPTYEVEVVDPATGLAVEPGETGELRIKGPAVSAGYLVNPGDGNESFSKDGWYCTGDMVKSGLGDQLFLVGRQHDMIKSRGLKVFPAEVESVLLQHPGVQDVVVVGILDRSRGETVSALVVPTPGETVSVRHLVEFARSKLEIYKVPTTIRFVSRIPRDQNGKVSRSRLASLSSPPRSLT